MALLPCAPLTRATSAATWARAVSQSTSTNSSCPRAVVAPGPFSSQPRRIAGRRTRSLLTLASSMSRPIGDGSGSVDSPRNRGSCPGRGSTS